MNARNWRKKFGLLIYLYVLLALMMIRTSNSFTRSIVQLQRKQLFRCLSSSRNAASQFPDKFSVAPLMDYTYVYQRWFQRLLSRKSVLYTEMIAVPTLFFKEDVRSLLEADFSVEEPVVLQLGGSDPKMMRVAAKKAYDYGYRQFNLNIGCPSERVAGAGCFGAALMTNPELVSELALAVSESSNAPTTIKCRLALDDEESYEFLYNFIDIISRKGKVQHFIVHARNAILGKKFTPEDNRSIPPLKYHYVYRLVRDFPHLFFTLNGGIQSLESIEDNIFTPEKHLLSSNTTDYVHGIMVGRSVVFNPFQWRNVDSRLYGCPDPGYSRREILEKYANYAIQQEQKNGKKSRSFLLKPLMNLFHNEPNGKTFRRILSENTKKDIPIEKVILDAMNCLPEQVLDLR